MEALEPPRADGLLEPVMARRALMPQASTRVKACGAKALLTINGSGKASTRGGCKAFMREGLWRYHKGSVPGRACVSLVVPLLVRAGRGWVGPLIAQPCSHLRHDEQARPMGGDTNRLGVLRSLHVVVCGEVVKCGGGGAKGLLQRSGAVPLWGLSLPLSVSLALARSLALSLYPHLRA